MARSQKNQTGKFRGAKESIGGTQRYCAAPNATNTACTVKRYGDKPVLDIVLTLVIKPDENAPERAPSAYVIFSNGWLAPEFMSEPMALGW